jgi:alanyl-tRNA synthetase
LGFCGCGWTLSIGAFRILSDAAVAAGVRRIEALAGSAAEAFSQIQDKTLQQLAALLKVAPDAVPARVEQLVEERKKLERELSDVKKKMATGGSGPGASDFKDIGGIKVSAKQVHGIPARDLKSVADTMKQKMGSGIVLIAGVDEDKASLVISVSQDLIARISAVDLIKIGTPILGGAGGGGRPEMAQGGGPDIDKIDAAFKAIEQAIAGKAA